MELVNTIKFNYPINDTIVKVKTASGVRLEIESYTCMDGISNGPHNLRLRRASHSNYHQKVTLKLIAPDCSAMSVRRTLVFNRGTTLLNLKIAKEEIMFLMGPARRTKLFGEITVENLNESDGHYIPLGEVMGHNLDESDKRYIPNVNLLHELCKPDEYTSLKSYESRTDLSNEITVQNLDESDGHYIPLGEVMVQNLDESDKRYIPNVNLLHELCKPDEYTSLKSYESRTDLSNEIKVQNLDESARHCISQANKLNEFCKPDEYTSLKSYESRTDLSIDIDAWQTRHSESSILLDVFI